MDNGISVSADEMIDELMNRVAQLTMEIAAKDIIIRKLQEPKVADEDG